MTPVLAFLFQNSLCGSQSALSAAPSRPKLKSIFSDKFRGFGGFLGRFDQNGTYHTSNEDNIEHMKATCKVDERSL